MKTIIFLFLAITTLSCSNDSNHSGDENIFIPDQLVGKWIIYKAEYNTTVYEYEINGQCGNQALEMFPDNGTRYKSVTETFYTNEDCTGYDSRHIGRWVKADGDVYNIYSDFTVPDRTLTLIENEIIVTEPGFITVKKYYKRAF